jgi:carboxyl-terminal processing protease
MNEPRIDDKNSFLKGKFILSILLGISLILGFSIGFLLASALGVFNKSSNSIIGGSNNSSNVYYDNEYIDNIVKILNERYINDLPEEKDLTYGMVKGLIESLGDQYTSFLDPEEAKQYLEGRNPDFEGIGVTLSFKEGNTYIESVLGGYPAERAGFQNGDVIIEVDGIKMEGERPSSVASNIRGEKGTEVKIKVYRASSDELLDFTAIREKIDVSNINSKDLGNGVYQITITQFIDNTAEEFNKEWDKIANEIDAKNPKSLIIDLRNNPGGYVYSVNYVLEDFLLNNQIVFQEESKDKGVVTYRDRRSGRFEDIPVIVLVNEGSASASEIFSAAIQENDRGEIVGKPTVGKGVEQTLVDDFKDDSLLILVFQKWLTPDGNNIDAENPIKPDYEVEYTNEDFEKGIDTQLEKAKELLR